MGEMACAIALQKGYFVAFIFAGCAINVIAVYGGRPQRAA